MRIKMLTDATVRLDAINSTNYPNDWTGDVPDLIGRELVAKGVAEQVETPAALLKPGQQFTDAQAAVLAAAADQALAAHLAAAGGETVDPETGEVTGGQTPAEVLASMTKKELDALAKQNGVKTVGVSRVKIQAALLAKIAAAA